MKLTELRSATKEELTSRVATITEEIRALEMGLATATFRKPNEVSMLKKERAQILTILGEQGTLTRH